MQANEARRRAALTTMERVRLVLSGLVLALGLIIVVQGIRFGEPWTYTVVGVLMAGLGAYRLRLAAVLWRRTRDHGSPDAR